MDSSEKEILLELELETENVNKIVRIPNSASEDSIDSDFHNLDKAVMSLVQQDYGLKQMLKSLAVVYNAPPIPIFRIYHTQRKTWVEVDKNGKANVPAWSHIKVSFRASKAKPQGFMTPALQMRTKSKPLPLPAEFTPSLYVTQQEEAKNVEVAVPEPAVLSSVLKVSKSSRRSIVHTPPDNIDSDDDTLVIDEGRIQAKVDVGTKTCSVDKPVYVATRSVYSDEITPNRGLSTSVPTLQQNAKDLASRSDRTIDVGIDKSKMKAAALSQEELLKRLLPETYAETALKNLECKKVHSRSPTPSASSSKPQLSVDRFACVDDDEKATLCPNNLWDDVLGISGNERSSPTPDWDVDLYDDIVNVPIEPLKGVPVQASSPPHQEIEVHQIALRDKLPNVMPNSKSETDPDKTPDQRDKSDSIDKLASNFEINSQCGLDPKIMLRFYEGEADEDSLEEGEIYDETSEDTSDSSDRFSIVRQDMGNKFAETSASSKNTNHTQSHETLPQYQGRPNEPRKRSRGSENPTKVSVCRESPLRLPLEPSTSSDTNVSSVDKEISRKKRKSEEVPTVGDIYWSTLGLNNKNPVQALHEYCHKRRWQNPSFQTNSMMEDGRQCWSATVKVNEAKYTGVFKFKKKDAKLDAVKRALKCLGAPKSYLNKS